MWKPIILLDIIKSTMVLNAYSAKLLLSELYLQLSWGIDVLTRVEPDEGVTEVTEGVIVFAHSKSHDPSHALGIPFTVTVTCGVSLVWNTMSPIRGLNST